MARARAAPAALLCLLALPCADAAAAVPRPDQVLVVANGTSRASMQLADYYVRARGIPADHVVRIAVPPQDEISRAEYARNVERPVAEWLLRRGAQDRVRYIVLMRGVPLRIAGTLGREGTTASVDSELALIYRRLAGGPVKIAGPVQNPYFLGPEPLDAARPFSHQAHDVTLVSRLDGVTEAHVRAFIDRTGTPAVDGVFALDRSGTEDAVRERLFREAAAALLARGFEGRVVTDDTSRPLRTDQPLLGYFSSGAVHGHPRLPEARFAPGAIASGLFAGDAGTFQGAATAGSPGLGTLIGAGAAAAGSVADPYVDGAIRPAILFPAYLAGMNQVDAFYLALPYLSWQSVIVADPFCAPFGRQQGEEAPVEEPAIDARTGLPHWFAARRVAALAPESAVDGARVQMALAETRLARDDFAAAEQAIEAAIALDPRFARARLFQAGLLKRAGFHERSAEAYREVLAVDPNNVPALNDLAYLIAVDLRRPAEALLYAERAFRLAEGDSAIADTIGWVHHLLGDNIAARRYLEQAVSGSPERQEFRIHAALVYAALGETDLAVRELAAADALSGAAAEAPAPARPRKVDGAAPVGAPVVATPSRSTGGRRAAAPGRRPKPVGSAGPGGKAGRAAQPRTTRPVPRARRGGAARPMTATEVGLSAVCSPAPVRARRLTNDCRCGETSRAVNDFRVACAGGAPADGCGSRFAPCRHVAAGD